MASRGEVRLVNLAGLAQGITLVTFPAASSIFTDPSGFDLSSAQYGALFIPQVLTAIATSLLGSKLAHLASSKRVLTWGLMANITSMLLLVVAAGLKEDPIAYPTLLVATAFLGAGFGLTVPVLNTYVASFQPERADRGVLVLNALLGLGTALAPVFVAIFVGLGFWWGLPLLSAAMLAALLVRSLALPLRGPAEAPGTSRNGGVPRKFWWFAAFAVLYGLCETVNGNWSQLDMTTLGATTTEASLALTAFWGMVTVGRLLFATLVKWLPSRAAFHLLPLVLVVTFGLIAALPDDAPWLGIAAFALAGLGCSALLPLTISLGQGAIPSMSTAVAGGVIAFYQVGYGIAAFGVGPLVDHGADLSQIYGWTALAAALMFVVSFASAGRQPSPPRIHPLPAGHRASLEGS